MNKEKLTMITLFSGTGMQERGFQDSNLFDLDVIGTSEIDADATLSYAAVHCGLTPEMIETYNFPEAEEMAQYLTDRKVGWDFQKNKGKDWFTYKKGKKLDDLKKYYLASVLQNNYGDISSIKELPYADFWTYSFPCTDISIAGKQEGLDTTCNDCEHKFNPMTLPVEERHICPNCGSTNIKGTRSGLLAEVERLLTCAVETGTSPKYLLLENVKNLVGKANKPDFDAWVHRLSDLNYNTYYEVLNAKFCGIPQNRERVFALSIRKDIDTGNFTFPTPFDNGLRLKHILETDVDEKYYINTERAMNLIQQLIDKGQLQGQRACADSTINDPNTREISNCITARYDASIQNQKQIGLVVCEPNAEQKRLGGLWDNETGKHQAGSVWDINGMSPTLDTAQGGGRMPHILENSENIQWKIIEEFPNYQINEYGEIKNKDGHIKSVRKDKDGYLRTQLYASGIGEKTVHIHKLVAKYFLPKTECMECINHKDGDIYNNHYTNLEWCSVEENIKHKNEILLRISGKAEEPKGVYWDKEREKWHASIKYHDKTIFLGRYDNKSDAYKASYYEFIRLRGYMPWDENKYRTFLKDGESIENFNQHEVRECNIAEYTTNNPQFIIGSTQKNAYVGDGSISSTLTSAMGEGGGHVPMVGFEDTTKPIYLGNTTPSGKSQCNAVYSTDGVSQTLCAGTHGYATGSILEEQEEPKLVKIKQATKQGYIECEVPGVADFSFPNSKKRRGRVQGGGQICPTLMAGESGLRYVESLYRIRKLTPNECWLLMGLTKEDCMQVANLGISNSALYKIAGNGIVTNCIKLIAEHLYKAQYDPTYICTDENFQKPQAD